MAGKDVQMGMEQVLYTEIKKLGLINLENKWVSGVYMVI